MISNNFVCKTVKIFAVLFLGVLFVTAFTMTNCAWAQGTTTGPGSGQTMIDDDVDNEGGEGGDITITPGSGPTITGPTLGHDDPNSWGAYGIVITEDGFFDYEDPVNYDSVFVNGESTNHLVVALTPGNTLTFNRDIVLPESIFDYGQSYPGTLYMVHGNLNIADGKKLTASSLTFMTGCDGFFEEDRDTPIRSISGEFNIDEIGFWGDEDSFMFSANGGNIIFNTRTPDKTSIPIDSGKISVLKDTKITLKKSLYVAADYDWDEENQINIPSTPGILTFACEDDVTLKVCCEAENSISAESGFISSGRVDILGVIEGSLEVEEGSTFSPGNSAGTTEVNNGNFTLDSGSSLLMEILGSGESGNDILIVSGDGDNTGKLILTAGAEIELVLGEGSSLEPGESFTAVLTADNSSDLSDILSYVKTTDFTELEYVELDSGDYAGKFAITGRRFTADEVPEPSTWALLVLGAAGLMYWRKKNA